ncbi:DUF6602 domain-containing protein [Kitasatospora purpeofusca]|uniref:DUF6602 domain-containing protein n=1 Tax=Kitasatospora purpeofusca TaxID=67352 RepID=UPI0036D31603
MAELYERRVVSQRELVSYFKQATMEMQLEYERIRARAMEDPGTAGDEGEENWASLLRKWLPGDLQIATKGRVLCGNGQATDQVDIVALSPLYPYGMLTKKMHLASEVMVIFECKSTLKAQHIEKTIVSASHAKEAIYRAHGKEVIYGLVAHSHSWRADKLKVVDVISGMLAGADETHVGHPNNSLDFLCIADLGTWVLRAESDEDIYGPGVVSYYSGPSFTGFGGKSVDTSSIGRMITYVLRRLSYLDGKYNGLAGYFGMAGLEGPGSYNSKNLRKWKNFESGRRHVDLFL